MPQEIEKNDSVVDDLMPKEAFERRFAFIDNDTLKKNIAIAFEYIIFLIETASKEGHKKLIKSSLYKDALLYTGTIVEACLLHVLIKYVSKKKLQKSKVLSPDWKEEAQGIIHLFNKKRRIRYIIEHLVYEDVKSSANFVEINRACLRGHILTREEYSIAEEIREARNKIHVSALINIDNSYKKEYLDNFFDKANKIIKKVEKKLLKLLR